MIYSRLPCARGVGKHLPLDIPAISAYIFPRDQLRPEHREEIQRTREKRKTEMCPLLKLTMLLFCVRVGEGHWLHTLLASGVREQSGSSESGLPDETGGQGREEDREEREGSGRRWGGSAPRSRRSTDDPCGLHSILLQVRDLGLGYDSDEMVLFKYCSGACPRVPSNHELTLTNLRLSGALPPTETWHYTPCCRPTRHEDMAFLDNAHRWHKVEKLSAAACSCVG